MLTLDNEQIRVLRRPGRRGCRRPVVHARAMLRALQRPNLKAYVVTAERAARRYEELGVDKPYHVIPQGVSLSSLTRRAVAQTAAARREPGRRRRRLDGRAPAHRRGPRRREAALQRRPPARALGRDPRAAPAGPPLARRRRQRAGRARGVAGRDDIVLFGRLPREQALATAADFDLALYPRTQDTGIQAAKVGEFIGLGVPTVSYDYEVTENLRETGAGVLVPTPREFVDAVVRLGEDEAARGELAAAARRAGAELDWDVLARRYEEILDRYLPRRLEPISGTGALAGRSWRRSPPAPRRRSRSARARGRRRAPRRSRAAAARAACPARSSGRRRPKRTSATASAGQRRPEGRARERRRAERCRGRDEQRDRVERATATSVNSVLSATPQMPTVVASDDGEDDVRSPGDHERARDLALPRAGDQELRDEVERLVHEQHERQQRQHGRALAVARRRPSPRSAGRE